MKTIEIWAPALAVPAASVETVLPVKAKTAQADLQRFAGVEEIEIDLAECVTLPGSKTKFLTMPFDMRPYDVNITVLSDNLKEVLTNFQQLVNDIPKPASGYFIDEIEINLGVNGSGGIALIGKMEVGMEAAIKVKIKREAQ